MKLPRARVPAHPIADHNRPESFMPTRTIFLAKLIGLFCLIAGLSMLAQIDGTIAAVEALAEDRPMLLVTGLASLLAGLAMVIAHNRWTGGLLTVTVTLIGWIVALRAMILLFLSRDLTVRLLELMRFEDWFVYYVAIAIGLGVYLTAAAFMARPERIADSHPGGRRGG
jgi:hypothetical protein